MMRFFIRYLAIFMLSFGVLSVADCNAIAGDSPKDSIKRNLFFEHKLTDIYKNLANAATKDYSNSVAEYYARRVSDLARGAEVLPISNKTLIIRDRAYRHELKAARGVLLDLKDKIPSNVKDVAEDLARAYGAYDCWAINQQSEDHVDKACNCRRLYYRFVDNIYLATGIAEHRIVKNYKKLNLSLNFVNKHKMFYNVNVFFDSDSAGLGKTSAFVLDRFVDMFQSTPNVNSFVVVSCYTDSVGTRDVNDRLAGDRCKNVKNYLVRKGIPANFIKTYEWADTLNIVNVSGPERANRRAEVYLVSLTENPYYDFK